MGGERQQHPEGDDPELCSGAASKAAHGAKESLSGDRFLIGI